MTRYALDTDMLSLWQHGHSEVSRQVLAHQSDELSVTVITVQEQLDGWHSRLPHARTPQRIADLYRRLANNARFVSRVLILDYTVAAVHRYELLRKAHRNLGRMDLRIAAIALEHNATIVTRNRSDFQRIPGLSIEDWSK